MTASRHEFSVIIPTYRRPQALKRVLAALSELEYPRERFEVIVVNDGGPDDVEAAAARFRGILDLTYLDQRNTGPARARNYGASRARGRYLAFTDDDCVPEPGWLQGFRAVLSGPPGAACGGQTKAGLPLNLYAAATQIVADVLQDREDGRTPKGAFFSSNNLCVPRQRFLEIGGFDATMRFGEDREFCHRWTARGGEFRFAPDAVVAHSHQLGFWSFLLLHLQYGYGSGVFRWRCARKGLPPARFNSLGWYGELVASGLRQAQGFRGLSLCALLALSQSATAAGMGWSCVRQLAVHLRRESDSRDSGAEDGLVRGRISGAACSEPGGRPSASGAGRA